MLFLEKEVSPNSLTLYTELEPEQVDCNFSQQCSSLAVLSFLSLLPWGSSSSSLKMLQDMPNMPIFSIFSSNDSPKDAIEIRNDSCGVLTGGCAETGTAVATGIAAVATGMAKASGSSPIDDDLRVPNKLGAKSGAFEEDEELLCSDGLCTGLSVKDTGVAGIAMHLATGGARAVQVSMTSSCGMSSKRSASAFPLKRTISSRSGKGAGFRTGPAFNPASINCNNTEIASVPGRLWTSGLDGLHFTAHSQSYALPVCQGPLTPVVMPETSTARFRKYAFNLLDSSDRIIC
jgi:hypothetical protein